MPPPKPLPKQPIVTPPFIYAENGELVATTTNQDDKNDDPKAGIISCGAIASTHLLPPPILCSLYLMEKEVFGSPIL